MDLELLSRGKRRPHKAVLGLKRGMKMIVSVERMEPGEQKDFIASPDGHR
jgi:hypothetical protein